MAEGAQLYALIWWISVTLAFAAIAIMTVLVAVKFRRERTGKLEKEIKSRVLRQIREALPRRGTGAVDLPTLDEDERAVLPKIVGELIESVPTRQQHVLVPMLRKTGVVSDLAAILENGDLSERVDAAVALSYFPDREAIEAFRKALADEATEIRVHAIKALTAARAIPYMNWLLDRLEIADRAPERDVIEVIAAIPGQGDFWLQALRSLDSPPGAKICAIRALAQGEPNRETLRELFRATQSHEPDVRAQALRALGLLESSGVLRVVPDALRDAAWPVRTQAAFCAGRLRFKEALPALVAMLNSEIWWERYRAAEAIARLGREGREALEKVARQPTPAGRAASITLSDLSGQA